MLSVELNYTITKKEFLAMVFDISKFKHYVIGYDVFMHTDHSDIKYIMNKHLTSGRITRWLRLLEEFNVTIIDRPIKSNVVVDYLSRLRNIGQAIPVDNSFPDEYPFLLQ